MDDTEKIRRRYDRASKLYDLLGQPMEAMSLKKWRLEATKDLKGKVLEIGVGTGKNIPYYPHGVNITELILVIRCLLWQEKRQKSLINQ